MLRIPPLGSETLERVNGWHKLIEIFSGSLRESFVQEGPLDFGSLHQTVGAWEDFARAWDGKGDFGHPSTSDEWERMRAVLWCAEYVQRITPLSGGTPPAALTELAPTAPREALNRAEWSLACIRLFRGEAPGRRIAVPIALADEMVQLKGGIATLVLDVFSPGMGRLTLHPEESFRVLPDADFTESLNTAWQLALEIAKSEDGQRDFPDVVWRVIRESPSMSGLDEKAFCESSGLRWKGEIKGRSASGAAARAFFHLLKGTSPDPDVFVLMQVRPDATPAASNHLQGVGGITAKVGAVANTRRYSTVVVAQSDESEAKIALSGLVDSHVAVISLGVTKTLDDLYNVRSQLATGLRSYYTGLIKQMDQVPFVDRYGEPVRASQVAIDARVLKPSRGFTNTADSREDQRSDRSEKPRSPAHPLDADVFPNSQEPRTMPWSGEILNLRRAVVLGEPGSGKTFLAATTAREIARRGLTRLDDRSCPLYELPLPIYVLLSRLASEMVTGTAHHKAGDALKCALRQILRLQFDTSPPVEEWMDCRYQTRDCWLVLDAFDEVIEGQDKDECAHLATYWDALNIPRWEETRVVVTCRKSVYEPDRLCWRGATEYELAPFTSVEIRLFVEHWFGQDDISGRSLNALLTKDPSIASACSNPLVLTLACSATQERELTAQARRADLYYLGVLDLLRRRGKGAPLGRNSNTLTKCLKVLKLVAGELAETEMTAALVRHDRIVRAVKRVADADANKDLVTCLVQSRILQPTSRRDSDEVVYTFIHRSFLDFLVACDLADRLEVQDPQRSHRSTSSKSLWRQVSKKAWLPQWYDIIKFLAGRLRDPRPLLRLLLDEKQDDVHRHRLLLAAHCIPELAPQQLSLASDVVDQITTDVISLLWDERNKCHPNDYAHLEGALPCLAAGNGKVDGLRFWDWVLRELESPDATKREWTLEHVVSIAGGQATTASLFDRLSEMARDFGPFLFRVADPVVDVSWRPSLLLRFLNLSDPTSQYLWSRFSSTSQQVLANEHASWDEKGQIMVEEIWAILHGSPLFDVECFANISLSPHTRALVDSRPTGSMALLLNCRLLDDAYADISERIGDKRRAAARKALRDFAPAAVRLGVTDRLLKMTEGAPLDRWKAAAMFEVLGVAAVTEEAVRRLHMLLHDPDHDVCDAAAHAICAIGPAAASVEVVYRLLQLSFDPDPDTVQIAVRALGRVGQVCATEEVASRLTELLSDADSFDNTSLACTWALGDLAAGSGSPEVAMLLLDRGVFKWAGLLLGVWEKFRSSSVADVLVGRLLQLSYASDMEVVSGSLRALRGLGAVAATRRVVERVEELTRHTNTNVSGEADAAFATLFRFVLDDNSVAHYAQLLLRHGVYGDSSYFLVAQFPEAGRTKILTAVSKSGLMSKLLEVYDGSDQRAHDRSVQLFNWLSSMGAMEHVIDKMVEMYHDPKWTLQRAVERVIDGRGSVSAAEKFSDWIIGCPDEYNRCARWLYRWFVKSVKAYRFRDKSICKFVGILDWVLDNWQDGKIDDTVIDRVRELLARAFGEVDYVSGREIREVMMTRGYRFFKGRHGRPRVFHVSELSR